MPAPVHILLLDDSAEDRAIFRRFLSGDPAASYEFREEPDVDSGLQACRQAAFDCVLLDYSLGGGTGLDFLDGLRELGGTVAFPVVMLTGTGDEAIAVEALKNGAQDYIVKKRLTPDILRRAVAGAIYKAQTDRLLAQQRLELESAYHAAQLARETAERANAAKDQFLAALSHELRTPLMPVLAAVRALDDVTISDAERHDIVATIRRNVELEARLIDDLLDLTRIAKGKLRIEPRPADLQEVLGHALDICRQDFAAKGITLRTRFEADSHVVLADAARLQQIFWNLLKNAGKFTPKDGMISVVTRCVESEGGAMLEVEISDTGIGIPPEMLGRIFDVFEQGDVLVTRRFGGLGLGLAITKALVEAHGGTIRVESDGPGRGASFFVTLPLAREAASSVHGKGGAAYRESAAPETRPRTFTVLFVEDHADSARMLSRLMERRGYRVICAGSVAEAVAAFAREPGIELVISDIGLPDGTGLELMEQIAAQRSVPAIALSGFGMEHDLARSRAAGFHEHLTKPVDWPRLEAAIARLSVDRSASLAL